MVDPHTHNDSDSPAIPYENIQIISEDTIDEVAGTADGTYSSNEQTLINDLKVAVNALIAALQAKRIIK